jgi:hypothetical protein
MTSATAHIYLASYLDCRREACALDLILPSYLGKMVQMFCQFIGLHGHGYLLDDTHTWFWFDFHATCKGEDCVNLTLVGLSSSHAHPYPIKNLLPETLFCAIPVAIAEQETAPDAEAPLSREIWWLRVQDCH